jgi:hypothetical protein
VEQDRPSAIAAQLRAAGLRVTAEVEAYLGEDERVYVYDAGAQRLHEVDSPQDLGCDVSGHRSHLSRVIVHRVGCGW